MGWITFLGMIVTGSVFSGGLLLLFKRKPIPGVIMLLLSVVCYIAFVNIATTYFA